MNLLIVLAGFAALRGVEVRELPKVERPVVTIRAFYPGAAPETMDTEVTRILEGAAARVPGVQDIAAASEEGNSRARVYFSSDVDINIAANDVREAISEVERQLPDGVEDVTVVKANDESSPMMRLAVSTRSLSDDAMTKIVRDQIVPELLGVPGVADVQTGGDRKRTLRIVVDPLRLATYRLSIAAVAAAIENAGLDVPAGSFSSAGQDLIVRADAALIKAERIARIRLDRTTRLGDVASVFYAPEEAESYVRYNGQPIISMGVIRQAQSNTIEISEGITDAVERLNRRLGDVQIAITADDAVFIRGATREVLFTLGIGVAIVVLVTLLFLGSARLTLIPAVTIPVALIGTVAGIWLFGFSINILTLLALVLATGLVVDDAIVVLENIERTRRGGVAPRAAAVLGTRQVFFAVIATTVTLASVFIPIAFLPGRAGQLFTEFGFVLALSVGLSSFVALSLCPMIASRLISANESSNRVRQGLGRAGTAIAGLYGRTLAGALRAPVLVCGLALGGAALVGSLFNSLDQELVPKEDRGLIVISMRGPEGVNQDYMDRQVRKVEALVQPLVDGGEVKGVLAQVGRYDPNRGFVILPLADWGARRPQEEIAASLKKQLDGIPGARIWYWNRNSLGIRTGGSDLEFALTGPEYRAIAKAGDEFVRAIEEEVPRLGRPRMDYSTTQPQLEIVIDRDRATDLGIELDSVARTLEAMVEGSEIAELNVLDETVPVIIESATGAVNDTDDLANLHLMTSGGRAVPLSSLISIKESAVAAELDREAQRRAIEIEAELLDDYPLDAAVAELERLAAKILPPDIDLVLLGQAEALEEAARDMAVTFAMALLVVLLVLAGQFESFRSAGIVLITVPFGLAAAVLALWLTGLSLNIYSQIGLVMLVGLMAKNGILIVEFANQLRAEGRSIRDAAHEAAMVRLRPVVMTMLSTSFAALPLILSTGAGAEARESIGWVIFGGLGIAIVAVLYVTPVFYILLAPRKVAVAAGETPPAPASSV